MLGALAQHALAPARWYAAQLERRPLLTKSVTSGLMYALGDVAAQAIEARAKAKEEAENAQPFRVDWQRAGIFFFFGTAVGGPAYAAWFGACCTLALCRCAAQVTLPALLSPNRPPFPSH